MITRRLLEAPDGRGWIFLAILATAAIAVPLLNLLVPPSSPYHVPTSAVALWGKYLCYALLALSLDLVWGYCGILSLGHGAFFALGGYAMGMYMMRQIGTRGVYAHPILPDFMVFLNWPELPVFWWGFNWFPYAALMVLVVPGALAFVFGWFAFRSRVTGVYLSIITQALTFALMLGFFRNNFGFGGNNGLTDFKDILGFNVQSAPTRAALFALSAIALGLGYLIAQAVVRSKAGKVLIAIRDAESRTRFLGYRVENYKTYVFTLSACMAAVAGALYVPQVGIINPSEFAPANSIEYVIWVAVGGRGTLVGAALGAVVVNYAKTTFTTGLLAPYWLFALGALFVLVTIFLPKGILGLIPSRATRSSPDSPPHRAEGASPTRRGEGLGVGGIPTIAVLPSPPPCPSPTRGEGIPSCVAPHSRPSESPMETVLDRSLTQSLLYLDGVTVSFDGFRALDNLSLDISHGEMRAIIGPNGAGKTTMMDVITGKTKPDSGEVLFDKGIDLTTKDEAAIAELGIGRKFQKPTVFENQSVEDNVLLSLKSDRSVRRNLLWRGNGEESARIGEILNTIGLAAQRKRLAESLSHGQKQWLEIGMLIAQDPKLLLVDEPVAGMTDSETMTTAELLKDIARDHTVLVVEHDMEFVRRLGVKVTVLHEGSVLAEGTIDEVSANERVVEVYLGR